MLTFIFTTFISSFFLMIVLVLNKLKEIETGSGLIPLHFNVDEEKMKTRLRAIKVFIKHLPKMVAVATSHFVVKQGIFVVRKFHDLIYPRISHIVEKVQGKDIPKTQGGASFFLVNIQKHKESMKKKIS